MRCRKAQKLISAKLDTQLDAARVSALEAHTARCFPCQRFAAELASSSRALDAFGAPEPRPGFTDRLLTRLPQQRSTPSRLRQLWEALRPAPVAGAAMAMSCGIVMAIAMNGAQAVTDQVESRSEEASLAEWFDALPADSAGAKYLALLQSEEE